jgi:hypothetical protein
MMRNKNNLSSHNLLSTMSTTEHKGKKVFHKFLWQLIKRHAFHINKEEKSITRIHNLIYPLYDRKKVRTKSSKTHTHTKRKQKFNIFWKKSNDNNKKMPQHAVCTHFMWVPALSLFFSFPCDSRLSLKYFHKAKFSVSFMSKIFYIAVAFSTINFQQAQQEESTKE